MSNKLSTVNIFNQSVKELEKSMNAPEYNSWVRPLEFDLKENNFNIYAPNAVSYTHLTLPTNREV